MSAGKAIYSTCLKVIHDKSQPFSVPFEVHGDGGYTFGGHNGSQIKDDEASSGSRLNDENHQKQTGFTGSR